MGDIAFHLRFFYLTAAFAVNYQDTAEFFLFGVTDKSSYDFISFIDGFAVQIDKISFTVFTVFKFTQKIRLSSGRFPG